MPRALQLAVQAESLRKWYGRQPAVQDVSLQIEPGELFGLLGPNGAGKTTLISILSALLRADSGSATIFGLPVTPKNRALRRLIGIVPQELALYGELSPRENLTFFGKLYGLQGRTLKRRVDQVLGAIGLSGRADDPAETFSGGMKRRLNLGLALVHEPKLLLLDEPTTGVDPQSRNHIFNEITSLNENGLTIIYTSHYMEEVQTLCRRIAIMDHGRVVACDTRENLLRLLPGQIRLTLPRSAPELLARLQGYSVVTVHNTTERHLEVECPDTSECLKRLVPWLHELGLTETRIEVTEPNLERVFLQLTGHALRD